MRRSVRESTGVALNSNHLETSTIHRTATDFVMALGGSPELGSMLWHIKYAGQDHLLLKTLDKLVSHIWNRPSKPRKHIIAICKLALEEWSIDRCLSCEGKGYLGKRETLQKKMFDCDVCHGKKTVKKGKYLNVEHGCTNCHGNGYIFSTIKIPAEKHRACPTCNATGRYTRTDEERAIAMGLTGYKEPMQVGMKQAGNGEAHPFYMWFTLTPAQQFTSQWLPKYQKVLDELRRLDKLTDACVKEAIR